MLYYYVNINAHQNQVTRFQQQSVYVLEKYTERENNKLVYESKKIGYNQYCDKYYPLDLNRHVTNEEYTYGFVWHNAHREKSKTH